MFVSILAVIKVRKLCICLLACLLCINTIHIYANEAPSLMIVAHPDDETIWGGSHLLNGNYTILCITNGDNKTRKAEFKKILEQTNSKGTILSFPDKTNGKRNNWKSCKKDIKKEIKKMIDSKDWKEIVTHNPNGEYGHIHHKMTSKMVTKILKSEKKVDKLIYFGKYTSQKNKDNLINEESILSKDYKQKLKLCDVYSSQKKVMNHLHHMLKHENWIPYANWDKMK